MSQAFIHSMKSHYAYLLNEKTEGNVTKEHGTAKCPRQGLKPDL